MTQDPRLYPDPREIFLAREPLFLLQSLDEPSVKT